MCVYLFGPFEIFIGLKRKGQVVKIPRPNPLFSMNHV